MKEGNYTNGKVKITREDEYRDKVSMGPRVLGYLDRRDATFKCWREKPEHYFRLYSGYGFNVELLLELRTRKVDTIIMILSDFTSGERIQKLMVINKEHWIFTETPAKLKKRKINEKKFEAQVVVPEAEFITD